MDIFYAEDVDHTEVDSLGMDRDGSNRQDHHVRRSAFSHCSTTPRGQCFVSPSARSRQPLRVTASFKKGMNSPPPAPRFRADAGDRSPAVPVIAVIDPRHHGSEELLPPTWLSNLSDRKRHKAGHLITFELDQDRTL